MWTYSFTCRSTQTRTELGYGVFRDYGLSFFTASKLDDSQPIIFVRPEFFSTEVVGLDTLDNFVVGDINTWDKAFFLINTTKRSVNWSLAIYHREESLQFFDPSIHYSSDTRQRGYFTRQRTQLFTLILAAVGRLHELDGTVRCLYPVYRYFHFQEPQQAFNSVTVANPTSYNAKERNINEGLHVILIAESFLANFGDTKLEFFDQQEERHRVLGNLEGLLQSDDSLYVPRPIIQDKHLPVIFSTDVFDFLYYFSSFFTPVTYLDL